MVPSLPLCLRGFASCCGTGAAFLNAFGRAERRTTRFSLESSSLLAGLSGGTVGKVEILGSVCVCVLVRTGRGGVRGRGTSPEGKGDFLGCCSNACKGLELLSGGFIPGSIRNAQSICRKNLFLAAGSSFFACAAQFPSPSSFTFETLPATLLSACADSTITNSLVDGFMPTHSSGTKLGDCGICRTRCLGDCGICSFIGGPDETCLSLSARLTASPMGPCSHLSSVCTILIYQSLIDDAVSTSSG